MANAYHPGNIELLIFHTELLEIVGTTDALTFSGFWLQRQTSDARPGRIALVVRVSERKRPTNFGRGAFDPRLRTTSATPGNGQSDCAAVAQRVCTPTSQHSAPATLNVVRRAFLPTCHGNAGFNFPSLYPKTKHGGVSAVGNVPLLANPTLCRSAARTQLPTPSIYTGSRRVRGTGISAAAPQLQTSCAHFLDVRVTAERLDSCEGGDQVNKRLDNAGRLRWSTNFYTENGSWVLNALPLCSHLDFTQMLSGIPSLCQEVWTLVCLFA
ncbi:uncharacterized protein J3D65DRAFT_260649 [Phyllosticta citribraziliensis]|uniref:Uncharacterized protein n=1 Tax=Phyllosticta citribraziliensis TaxID=989973 RepID=A0ABR1M0C9_9PEZI